MGDACPGCAGIWKYGVMERIRLGKIAAPARISSITPYDGLKLADCFG
jgi:Zn-finger nucleic acid-binding protein